jgi:hypothetical protein
MRYLALVLAVACQGDRGVQPSHRKIVDFAPLAKLTFDDLGPTEVVSLNEHGVKLRVTPSDPPPVRIVVGIGTCEGPDCVPIDLARWRARRDELLAGLGPDLAKSPLTVLEIGEATIAGHKTITIYQAAVFHDPSTPESPHLTSHALTVHWNDGVNRLVVIAADASPPMTTTIDDLIAIVPKRRLESLARTAFVTALRAM